MPTITETFRYVNQIQPGKKFGTCKNENRVGYVYPVGVVIPQGQPVQVTYEEQNWGGEPKRVISSVGGGGANGASNVAPSANGYAPRSSNTNENIFVCGVLNNAVAHGAVNPLSTDEIVACVKAARAAWAETLG